MRSLVATTLLTAALVTSAIAAEPIPATAPSTTPSLVLQFKQLQFVDAAVAAQVVNAIFGPPAVPQPKSRMVSGSGPPPTPPLGGAPLPAARITGAFYADVDAR